MTFEARAARLAGALSITPRQARFLTLVALIGGYCLRRQYGQFAGIAQGKNAALFLDDLVRRGLATQYQPRRHRAYVYHLKHRTLYDALGLVNNRHRRPALASRQARRLMLLDFALAHPSATWYATEMDKVALFTTTLGVPATSLPGRIYRSNRHSGRTLRQFVLKLPIYRLPNDPAVYFVYLGVDTTGQALDSFLADHAALIRSLAAWHLVVVHPRYLRGGQRGWYAAVARAHFLKPPSLSSAEARELHAYFRVRHALTDGATDSSITIDHAYEQRRRRFAGSAYDGLYAHWCAVGGPQRQPDSPPDFTHWRPTGAVSTHELPYSYDLFGSFPGIA